MYVSMDRMYNNVLNRCFNQCVNTFHSKKLSEDDNKCLASCAEKYMHMYIRVGQRYNENQMQQQQQGVQQFNAGTGATQK